MASLEQRYEFICRGLDHEANVTNHRLSWAILFSAGLFAATTILMNAAFNLSAADANSRNGLYCLLLLLMIPTAGFGVWFSWKTLDGVAAAQRQFGYLRREYKKLTEAADFIPEHFPRPYGDPRDHKRGNAVARTMPKVLLTVWISVVAVEAASLVFYGLEWARETATMLPR